MAGDVYCKSPSFEQEWGKNRPKYKYFFNPNYAAQTSWNDIMLENLIIEKSFLDDLYLKSKSNHLFVVAFLCIPHCFTSISSPKAPKLRIVNYE